VSKIGLRVAVVAASVVLLAACSSSAKKGASTATSTGSTGATTGANSASEPTVTIGVITDVTGPASNTSQFTENGIKAGVALAASEGYKVKYVMADSATNPSAALAAAQKLVQQDNVFAVVGMSAVFFSAAPYLQSHGIPVIGGDYDGSEWLTIPSMFSVFPYEDFTKVSTTIGQLTKMLGGTNLGTLGYSISPSSANTAKAYGLSAEAAGIKAGYVNANVPFGTTNVGPLVLAMKDAGVDSIYPVTDTNTGLAAIVGLRQQGVDLKVPWLAETEGDLLAGGSESIAQSKGVYMTLLYQPPELNTKATQEIASYLKSGAGITTPPTLNEYMGYLSVDALVDGLKTAGPNASRAQFIQAMEGMTNYTGRGLLGSPISFAPTGRGDTAPCTYVMQYTGTDFKTIPKAEPYCGTMTGQKV
jgi:branched-chain amino acid transport system substrate-binding protein